MHPSSRPRQRAAALLLAASCVGAHLAHAAPWIADGTLNTARFYHSSTLLPDGRVLVVGGSGGTLTEIYDPVRRSTTATASLVQGRGMHTATLLRDGRVLVVGGAVQDSWSPNFAPFASVEIYDGATATWSAAAALGEARANHTATLLPDGRVLVVGGVSGDGSATPATAIPLASVEVYDPVADTWTALASMRLARRLHGATLLEDGRVLVTGGRDESDVSGRSAEIYDPANDTWIDTPDTLDGSDPPQQIASRYLHTATATADGAVLVMGGLTSASRIERYGADAGTWSGMGGLAPGYDRGASLLPSGAVLVNGGFGGGYMANVQAVASDNGTVAVSDEAPLAIARAAHVSTVLADGRVLVTGGAVQGGSGATASVESFDPAVASVVAAAPLQSARAGFSATVLRDGRVLLAGGSNGAVGLASVEIHDPATGNNGMAASMAGPRVDHTATLLPDGRVLVVGGRATPAGNDALATADLYDPHTNSWSSAGSVVAAGGSARHGHSATLLPDGSVLVAGGTNATGVAGGDGGLLRAVRYLPGSGTWLAAGTLPDEKSGHVAVLLPNAHVLVVGGRTRNGAIGGGSSRYRPDTGTWESGGPIIPRAAIAASFLADGRLLFTGGVDANGPSAAACVWDWQDVNGIQNPCIGAPALLLPTARAGHSSTLLPDGRVLVAGGRDASGALASTALLHAPRSHPFNDAETAVWRSSASLPAARSAPRAVLLGDGRVALFGGADNGGIPQASVQLFDPGRAPDATREPVVASASDVVFADESLALAGSGFRPWLDGSSGNTKASSSHHPVVQVQRVDDGRSRYLRWSAAQPPGDGDYLAPIDALDGFHAGLAFVRVWVNGVPSAARTVMLDRARLGVTGTAVGAGSIAPSGTQAVPANGSASFILAPDAGEVIDGISGDCPVGSPVPAGNGSYTLAVGPVTASCAFVVQFGTVHAIGVTVTPMQGGSATCTPNPVPDGGSATCTQAASTGYTFVGWSGDCAGAACTLPNVTAPRNVIATFQRITYPIAAAVAPAGAGTASCTPNPVPHGDDAACKAEPMPGYAFDGWSGDCSGASCSLDDVTAAAAVTAHFIALPSDALFADGFED